MYRSFLTTFLATGLLVAALAGCGKKPDGTPYGVDPARLPEGRSKTVSKKLYKQDMPKGAELNAATNAARTGQPALGSSPTPTPAVQSR